MANSSSTSILNPLDSTSPLVAISVSNVIKLQSKNYLDWKLQITAILNGYDLMGYVNGSSSPPPATITENDVPIVNPAYPTWFRQDQLLFGALLGSLSTNIISLVSQAKTSKELWDILAETFNKVSRGHIKQKKDQLKAISKGTNSITDYMHAVKLVADELASLGKPLDHEDFIDRILEGLDASYESFVEQINSRDSPISFEELHEKLINKELATKKQESRTFSSLPATAFATTRSHPSKNHNSRYTSSHAQSPHLSVSHSRPPKPFLGKCQWCGERGHVLSRCNVFKQAFPTVQPPKNDHVVPAFSAKSLAPKPQANIAHLVENNNNAWLLDSGASHHVTNDLANLSLHNPYDGTEELLIGDGYVHGEDLSSRSS